MILVFCGFSFGSVFYCHYIFYTDFVMIYVCDIFIPSPPSVVNRSKMDSATVSVHVLQKKSKITQTILVNISKLTEG